MKFQQLKTIANNMFEESVDITFTGGRTITISMFNTIDEEKNVLNAVSLNMADNSSYLCLYCNGVTRFIETYSLTSSSRIKIDSMHMFMLNKQTSILYQIDTGNVDNNEISIISLRIPYNRTNFITGESFTLIENDNLVSERYNIWSRFSFVQNGVHFCADEYGKKFTNGAFTGTDIEPIVFDTSNMIPDEYGIRYVPIEIHKWAPQFASISNVSNEHDMAFIKATSGMVNTDRIKLVNGIGTARLYPMGFVGELKLKIGYKFYIPWCEYRITIAE